MGYCCGRYESGDRLSQEHDRTIVDRLLAYHPGFDNKIGCGIDYITVMPASLSLSLSLYIYIYIYICIINLIQIIFI